MWIVYVIQNDLSKQLYFGVTQDLKRRIEEHNHGGKKFTTKKGNWLLIYAEAYRSKQDAFLREKRLKHHASGKYELLKRLKHSIIV